MAKIGDLIELTIDDIGSNGEGIGHFEGYTVFVPFVLKDERVKVRINHIKKSLIHAKLSKIITPSPNRVSPPCPHFYRCGGCDLMHMQYATQLEYKHASFINTLSKMISLPILVDSFTPSIPLRYRNKVQLPFANVDGETVLGFYRSGTNQVVSIDDCLLQGEWIGILIEKTKAYVKENNIEAYSNGKGILRHLVARYIDNKLCVTLVSTIKKLPNINSLYLSLMEAFENISLYININREKNNVILGKEIIHIAGSRQIINIMGVSVPLHPMSFFQTNESIMEKIYSEVVSQVAPHSNMVIIDAYSGVGLLGAIMAKQGAQIINVDEVSEAIADANHLYSKNGLSDFVENICGDSGKIIPNLLEKADKTKELVLILDPPRKGISASLAKSISDYISSGFDFKLVYISCNPATLARDLSLINPNTYITIRPYDMFPQTKHLETLVCMTRK